MFATSFTDVDAGATTIALGDLFTDGLVGADGAGASDNIQIWDADQQKFVAYFYRSSSKFAAGPAWVNPAVSLTTPVTIDIPVGAGFWYIRNPTNDPGTIVEFSPVKD